ncbi:DUF4386 family protein [Methanobacterium sp. ACI-7]|uniref:DUF4386 family protein n=1 Tax=unclassified Methanobacterium TaxID=2627676 RepID=UPI0039C3718A
MKSERINDNNAVGECWKGLYRIGGTGAIIAAVLLLMEIIIFAVWPQQTNSLAFFTLFQSNKLIGLLDFYLLEMFAYILFVPIFLALYFAIRRSGESYMLIAVILAIIGISVFLSTNNPFSLLSLSDQYAAATTEVQKSVLLAAGQAIIANTGQRAVGGFNMGFFFVSIAGLIVSAVMLRETIFSKTIAYIGIFAFVISLADYFRLIFLPSSVILTLIIAVTSGVLLIVWFILVGRRLLKLNEDVLRKD